MLVIAIQGSKSIWQKTKRRRQTDKRGGKRGGAFGKTAPGVQPTFRTVPCLGWVWFWFWFFWFLLLRFLLETPDALIGPGKLHLHIFSSGMISNFLKFLSTALQYLWSSPREQLQLERSRLIEDHQLQVERLKKSHSDFWLRWNSEKDFKEKLQSSRSKILNKDLTLEELRLLYEKQHREDLLALDKKFRFELRTFDQLRDQHRVVLQDSILRSRLWTSWRPHGATSTSSTCCVWTIHFCYTQCRGRTSWEPTSQESSMWREHLSTNLEENRIQFASGFGCKNFCSQHFTIKDLTWMDFEMCWRWNKGKVLRYFVPILLRKIHSSVRYCHFQHTDLRCHFVKLNLFGSLETSWLPSLTGVASQVTSLG